MEESKRSRKKIAMESRMLDLYQIVTNRLKSDPSAQFSDKEERAIKELISKRDVVFFYKLPSNSGVNFQGFKLCKEDQEKSNERAKELSEHHEDQDDCMLLAEAEICNVNILLSRKDEFINLKKYAQGVDIMKPSECCKILPHSNLRASDTGLRPIGGELKNK